MKFIEDMSIKDRLSFLQRYILVHSRLYYDKDTSVISDKKYDFIAKKLVELKNKYDKEWQKTDYYYCFKDFDGTTGFDLWNRLKVKDKKVIELISNIIYKMKGK